MQSAALLIRSNSVTCDAVFPQKSHNELSQTVPDSHIKQSKSQHSRIFRIRAQGARDSNQQPSDYDPLHLLSHSHCIWSQLLLLTKCKDYEAVTWQASLAQTSSAASKNIHLYVSYASYQHFYLSYLVQMYTSWVKMKCRNDLQPKPGIFLKRKQDNYHVYCCSRTS